MTKRKRILSGERFVPEQEQHSPIPPKHSPWWRSSAGWSSLSGRTIAAVGPKTLKTKIQSAPSVLEESQRQPVPQMKTTFCTAATAEATNGREGIKDRK